MSKLDQEDRDGLGGRAYFIETIFNPRNIAGKLSSKEAVLQLKEAASTTSLAAVFPVIGASLCFSPSRQETQEQPQMILESSLLRRRPMGTFEKVLQRRAACIPSPGGHGQTHPGTPRMGGLANSLFHRRPDEKLKPASTS